MIVILVRDRKHILYKPDFAVQVKQFVYKS